MKFLKNISLDQEDFLIRKSKIKSIDFIGKDFNTTANTNVDIFIMQDSVVSLFSKAVDNTISKILLITLKNGMLIPYHENKFVNSSKMSKFYFCQVSNRGWGHIVFINNQPIYNRDKGNVLVCESESISLGAGNSGWEPFEFLIAW